MPRSNQLEPLSPVSMRANVQKTSKETRRLQDLFHTRATEIKESLDLLSAAQIILKSLTPSDPWHAMTNHELIEKFENHAEALLSNSAFMDEFEQWSGIEEIKSVCTDKNWWKRRRMTHTRPVPKKGKSQRSSKEDVFGSTRSGSLDSTAIVDDNIMAIQTPTQEFPKTAKKGTSILRPRFSMSNTPDTPTQQTEGQRMISNDLIESDGDITDGELQLVQLPADLSQRIKNDKILPRKRKPKDIIDNFPKRFRNARVEAPPKDSHSIQYGRGRPPLSTSPVSPFELNFLRLDTITVK